MSIELYCEIYPEIAKEHPIAVTQWQSWLASWETYLRSQNIITEGEYELALAITDDPTIQKMNCQYRQKDSPTDVLSFAALEAEIPDIPSDQDDDYVEPTYLGDIIISQTTAMRQAEERGHSLTYELAWLAAHGILHLLGWDHPDDASLEAMLHQQDQMLQLISL